MNYYKKLSVITNAIRCEIVYKSIIQGKEFECIALNKDFYFPLFYWERDKTYIKAKRWLEYNYNLIEKYKIDDSESTNEIKRPTSEWVV